MKVRFDQAAPYEVEEVDAPFADRTARSSWPASIGRAGDADAPLAALVDVHGGAWSRGDRLTGALHCRALAASGLVVVSLDFRQGSAAKHPAASADVAAGLRYVRAHARRLGVDPRRVGIVGSSSGGQLALLAGAQARRARVRGHADRVARRLARRGAGRRVGRVRPGALPGRGSARALPLRGRTAERRLGLRRRSLDRRPPRLLPERGADGRGERDAHRRRARDPRACRPCGSRTRGSTTTCRRRSPTRSSQAYQQAGGAIERVHFPGARHGFIGQASADTDKAIAMMRDFIGRQLAR